MTDKEAIYTELLVLRCRRREKKALEELVDTWEKRLFYYVRRLLDDEQETWDVLQETWLKVFEGIGSLRDAKSLPVWLYRIARNTAVSHLRRKLSTFAFKPDENNPVTAVENNEIFRFEDAEQVHRALGELTLSHREVLTLFFLEDLSVKEVAVVLDVPPGTVKSRLYYAKRALKKVLERGK